MSKNEFISVRFYPNFDDEAQDDLNQYIIDANSTIPKEMDKIYIGQIQPLQPIEVGRTPMKTKYEYPVYILFNTGNSKASD